MVGDPGLLAPRQPLLGLQAVRTEREVTGGEQGREGPRLLAQERGGRQHRGLEEGSRRVRVWVRERRSRQDMGHGQDAGPQPGAGMMGGGGWQWEEVAKHGEEPCGADLAQRRKPVAG